MTPRRMAVLLTALLASAVLMATLTPGGQGGTDPLPASHPGGWKLLRDARHGFTIAVPPTWHRSRKSLTPQLMDPFEILTVASFPVRHDRRARCHIPGCPLPAIDGMGPDDVLISIQERGARKEFRNRRSMGALTAYPKRKRSFKLERTRLSYPKGGPPPCIRERLGWTAFEPFRDSGRAFYAFVAVGRDVSRGMRREMIRVLDSLSFEPLERASKPPAAADRRSR